MKHSDKLLLATAIGLTVLSLQGCGTPSTVERVRTELLLPPEQYLQDCYIPTLGDTNEQLAFYARAAKDSLISCNVDKAALRVWFDDVAEGRTPTLVLPDNRRGPTRDALPAAGEPAQGTNAP